MALKIHTTRANAFTIPTDALEAHGTFGRESTTLTLVECTRMPNRTASPEGHRGAPGDHDAFRLARGRPLPLSVASPLNSELPLFHSGYSPVEWTSMTKPLIALERGPQ